MSSLRPSTKPTPADQATADNAEQLYIARVVRWRWSWVRVFIHICGIADAARERNLEALQSAVDDLQTALLDLWFVKEKTAGSASLLPTVEEARVSGRQRGG